MLANTEQSGQSTYNLTSWRFLVNFSFLPWKRSNGFWIFSHYLNKHPNLGKLCVEQKMRPLIFSTALV